MKKLLIPILLVSMVNSGLAECAKPVTALKKGETAPCDGFLFTKKKEQEVRAKIEQHKLTLDQLRIKDEMINIYKKDTQDLEEIHSKERQKTELWRKSAESSTHSLVKLQSHQKNRDLLNIIIGIGLTVGAGIALKKASK